MSVLLPVEIGVLAIHAVVIGWELAGRKRRKATERQEEARKQEIERKLNELTRSCPGCVASSAPIVIRPSRGPRRASARRFDTGIPSSVC